MKFLWKYQLLEMAETDICYAKWRDDHDGAMTKWMRPLFVELRAFLSPKFALENGLEKPVFKRNIWNAAAGQRRL